MIEFRAVGGIVAGLLGMLASILYIRATLQGTTIPNRATWLIWFVENWILLFSYKAVPGTSWTVWVLWVYALGALVTFPLSLKFGVGGLNFLDLFCLCCSGASLVLWWMFNEPLIALLANIGIDFFGFPPTCRKAAARPETEDRAAWTIACASAFFNLVAAKELSFGVLSFPVYVMVLNAVMMYFLWRPRAQPSVVGEPAVD